MAQVIKLKRSAVTGKTPQTSSLQLGELAVNTTDGKIYLHRSSSSDDSIQSVLTTDATITGSLKLSGSQHISGSTNVMDDLTYGGNLTASLGSTSSFDRITSVGTSSIGFLIASGSNLLNLTQAQTGSFASSSDVQQILDESGSYLVDADTGSLGKVTLISDITGSITSTGSFGKLFGDGSDLENVADPEAISGSYLGLLSGSDDLTLGGGVSGSITSTASFGLFVGDGAGLTNVSTDTTAFASGSDLHQILAESSSYVVESETGSFASGSDLQTIFAESASYVVSTNTGSFVVNSQTSSFASGSDLQIIQAESASYVVSTNTGSFASGSDLQVILAESSSYVTLDETGSFASGSDLQLIKAESASYLNNDTTSSFGAVSMDSTLFVQGDISTSGSVIAREFKTEFVSSSIIFSSGSNQFGDTIDDTHKFTGSIELTGSTTIDGDESAINLTTDGIKKWQVVKNTADDFKINRFGGGDDGSFVDQPFSIASSSGITTINEQLNKSGGVTRLISGGSTTDGVSVYNDKKVGIGTGTTAIGDDKFLVAGDTGITGSLHTSGSITTQGDVSGSITSTGSFGKLFGDGSDLENVADPEAISGSYLGLLSGSDDLTLGGGVSGSITSTASFGLFVGDGSGLSNVSTETGSFASGSDFHQILAESSSYIVESETGSFASGSDVQGILDTYASGSDLHQILAESSSYVLEQETGSFASGSDLQIIKAESASYLNNDTTSSFGAVSMNSTLFVQGDISTSGSVIAREFKTEFVSSSILFSSGSSQFGDTNDDIHRFSGSIEVTGSNVIFSSGSKLGIGKTPTTVFEIESPDPKIKLGHSEENSNLNIFVNDNTGTVLQNTQEGARGRIDLRGFGSGSGAITYLTAKEVGLESGKIGVGIGINTPKVELQVEGAISSSGNVDVVSISGSKLTTIKGDNLTSISGSITSTASFGKIFGDGSSLSNVADPDAISGSFQGGGSNNISGSLISTASFGTLELVNSHGFVRSTETGSFASGSNLHQILAESSSYVVESETGSFVVNSQTSSFASGSDLQIIQAESASYVVSTNTGSFLQNSDTASFQSTIITSSLEITGSITIDGDESAIDLTTNGLRKFQIAKNTSDDFKINRYDGGGSFLDQPLSIASSSGITTILDELTRSGGVTRLIGGGSTQDGVGVYNDKKVGIGTGTTAIGDDKFLVAGDTGITGSLFVSSSITTPELINNTGTLKVSQSVSDGDIEISVNDGGTTTKALIIDGSDAGSFILGNNLRMGDNQKIRLGTSNDFNLYHDSSNSYINEFL